MTAVVLCGGLGTRLRAVNGDTPKALAPVSGAPFLHYALSHLCRQGIADVVLCTGYAAEQVDRYCGDGARWGLRVRYSTEDKPLGTAGAIAHAREQIRSNAFLVMNGDSLVRGDFAALLRYHAAKRATITIALVEARDKTRFGSVSLAADGAILRFNEKGEGGCGLINAGVYLLDRAVLATIPAGQSSSLEIDTFPSFIGKGLFGFVFPGPFIDIGTPESFAEAQTVLPKWLEEMPT